jgi:hypothetical protein
MKKYSSCALGALAAVLLTGTSAFAQSACQLSQPNSAVKHIVYLQFDNVHLRRDRPNVPSDLEQIPNLKNFLQDNGALFNNNHTPLISHTSVDIVTTETGVYGNRFGFTIGNSFGLYNAEGQVSFPSSFTYWTDKLADGTFELVNEKGLNTPAPWVPFTRAGCDVGAFSIANVEFENVTTDITNVFGANSPEAAEAKANKVKAEADFEGILIHCAQNSALCAKNGAPDILSQEPGGYTGFTALYGNINVAPAINNGAPSVNDLNGNVIADDNGNVGFPGFDPRPAQTLGYAAQMLEAGVPVVMLYIEDAHDNDPGLSGVPSSVEETFGPGETGFVTQLAAYNKAFGEFFARLAKDGITKDNTIFAITADENDHFVGGPSAPANCDGVNIPCTYQKKGELDADMSLLFSTEFNNTTPFKVHSDDAPTVYIIGDQNAQTDTTTRTLEQQSGQLMGFDTDADDGQGATVHVASRLADQTEQNILHMVTNDPNRTPNFIFFGNDDFFLFATGETSPACTPANNAASCITEDTGFAYNHGDFQHQIVRTWLGLVGPGVQPVGLIDDIFSDHTDTRPTILQLAGLKDDYAHDGRVLAEVIDPAHLPLTVSENLPIFAQLAEAYKQINAPVGEFGRKTLDLSTVALAGNDTVYTMIESQLKTLGEQRDAIASQMIAMLEGAEFNNQPINVAEAVNLIAQADLLLAETP